MRKLHVLFTKEDLDLARIHNKTVVVLDIMFATTTIVAALQEGATTVVPARDAAQARALAETYPEGSYLLAGELNMNGIEGFADPTPLALCKNPLADRTLIYSTTNGTVALDRARGAKRVLVGCLLNGQAVAAEICRDGTSDTVIIQCAGSMGAFNLEDYYGAGHMVSCLTADDGIDWQLSDAARSARHLFERGDAEACLFESRVGRLMTKFRLDHEVRFAARLDSVDLTPIYEGSAVHLI